MSGADLAAAALALVGTRFRLHGRDPASGLDCIGLLEAALARAGRAVHLPQGYPLRLSGIAQWLPDPAALGFTACEGAAEPGDVVLLTPAPGQFHLAVALGGDRFVHAHAGLRRVVETPARPSGNLLHHWRLIPR